ncbi:hypothetical protein RDI58_003971 [Solanum bulbocastanum]
MFKVTHIKKSTNPT